MPSDNIAKTSSDIEHVDWSTGTGSGHNYANVRFGSGSSQASQSSGDICRICHCESDPQNPLLTPCYCSGSLKYVHQSCLQQWLTASATNSCELCKFPFIMHTKIKPFNEWRSLDISGIERRRLCCSVLFHCAAALCVVWSLCVLIERAADDVQRGLIDWPFWTKLAVVTVGLTGGIVFMYIQCKAYLHLCHRWKARNRILLIQNAPEKIHPPPSPVAAHNSTIRTSRGPNDAHIIGGPIERAVNSVNGTVEINATSNTPNYYNSRAFCGTFGGLVGSGGGGGGDVDPAADIIDNESACSAAAAAMQAHNQRHLINAALQHGSDLDTQSAQSAPVQSTTYSHQQQQQQQQQQQSHHHHQYSHGTHSNQYAQQNTQQQHQQQQLQQQLQQQQQQHVAVAANIECAQMQQNYERDWALDDVVSQISFRPCPQGSGSMTPFHDSIHNVLEHSEASSRGSVNDLCVGSRQDLSTGGISSDTTGHGEHALQLSSFSGSGEHKAPSISSGVSNAVANGLGGFVYRPHTSKRYSNSSIFLENRDILNDSIALGSDSSNTYEYSTHPKIDYRHSSMLTSAQASRSGSSGDSVAAAVDETVNKELRHYTADTKLLGSIEGTEDVDDDYNNSAVRYKDADSSDSSVNGCKHAAQQQQQLLLQKTIQQHQQDTVLDLELPLTPLTPPAAYASREQQQLLQQQRQRQRQHQRQQPAASLRRSFDTVEVFGADVKPPDHAMLVRPNAAINAMPHEAQIDRSRLFFKSLPNLSSSCESLIKK